MLIPRYFFTNDFQNFYEYFLTKPHKKKDLDKGSYLWKPNTLMEKIHYIVSGTAQNYVEHEKGHKKIISFHGRGTVFPGYHGLDFKIENAIITKAMTNMQVLEFEKSDFGEMVRENSLLAMKLINWYASYVNLLLYENAHQEYNSSFIKLCNLLYLLFIHDSEHSLTNISQNDIADILGISRVHLTRALNKLRHENIIITQRRQIQIINTDKLIQYCSLETL